MKKVKLIDEQAVKTLATAIVAQQIKDWNSLVRDNAFPQAYNGIRRFFRSEWADQLCDVIGNNSLVMLDRLEYRRRHGIYNAEEE